MTTCGLGVATGELAVITERCDADGCTGGGAPWAAAPHALSEIARMGAISRIPGRGVIAGGFYERGTDESIRRVLRFRVGSALLSHQLSLDTNPEGRAAARCLAVAVAARRGPLHGPDVVSTRRALLAHDLGHARHHRAWPRGCGDSRSSRPGRHRIWGCHSTGAARVRGLDRRR